MSFNEPPINLLLTTIHQTIYWSLHTTLLVGKNVANRSSQLNNDVKAKLSSNCQHHTTHPSSLQRLYPACRKFLATQHRMQNILSTEWTCAWPYLPLPQNTSLPTESYPPTPPFTPLVHPRVKNGTVIQRCARQSLGEEKPSSIRTFVSWLLLIILSVESFFTGLLSLKASMGRLRRWDNLAVMGHWGSRKKAAYLPKK